MTSSVPGRVRRFKFSAVEDDALRVLVDKFGTTAWDSIARCMPGRNPRQCRDRWNHYLKRRVLVQWTPEEDTLLRRGVSDFGPKWSGIAPFLPDRTELDLQLRWRELMMIEQTAHEEAPSIDSQEAGGKPKVRFPSLSPDPTWHIPFPGKRADEGGESAGIAEASRSMQSFTNLGYSPLIECARGKRLK
jgi:hypothetical protein